MKNHLIKTIELLKFNWKTLLVFEIIYRLFGLAIIFPMANQLSYLSVRLTGNEYLINRDFAEYLSSPYTILIMMFLFLFIGIYITYEIVVLTIFFHSSYYKNKIGIYPLFISSLNKLKEVIIKYHILIVLSSIIFLLIVEGLHLVGIASTIQLPPIIYEELRTFKWFYTSTAITIIIISYLFIETIFFEIQCTIEFKKVNNIFSHSRKILKKNRLKIIFEFLSVNLILNILLYAIYFLIILLVGAMLFVFKEDSAVYPLLLSLLYTIYLVVGFVATIILIPINFAWINVWYYQNEKSSNIESQKASEIFINEKQYSFKILNRIPSLLSIILIIIILFIFSSVSNNPSHLELFNTPTVISHRGGGIYAPENTISAIDMGISIGADSVELDVRFTMDGVPILMHDSTLGRTTDDPLNRRVDSLTLEEIKLLDAGSWFSDDFIGEEIPTLVEAIESINNNVEIFIELKTSFPNSDDIIINIIEETSIESRVKILSFDRDILKDIKLKNDKIETMLLLESFVGDINNLVNIDYIDYYAFNYGTIVLNTEYVRILKQGGKGVYVWTVNNESAILEMIRVNVNGIITDSPILTRELVYSDGLKSIYIQLLEKLFTTE